MVRDASGVYSLSPSLPGLASNSALIGSGFVRQTYRKDGFPFRTSERCFVFPSYTPTHPDATDVQPAVVDRVFAEAGDWTDGLRGAQPPFQRVGRVDRSSIPPGFATGAVDDLATYWNTPLVLIGERTIPLGHAHNALALIGWTAVLYLTVMTYRNRPPLPRYDGACWHCRYDRTGLDTHTPCPECGRRSI